MATPPESGAGVGKATEQKKVAPTSHGRGGAGNINRSTTPSVDPASLETPTLKSSVYTTGRGGSGNMAKNTDPEEARRAQDVTGHPRRTSSNGQQHIGRGGAANVFKPSKEELEAAKKDEGKWESAIADDHKDGTAGSGKEKDGRSASGVKGLAEKGREFLFGKK